MGKKIKPSWGGAGELEFERIARINTRIGLAGKYITGTMGIRETTMGYFWLRPGMFDDDGSPSQQAVQRAMAIDPKLGEHWLSARTQGLQQRAMNSRAQMVAEAKKAAAESQQALREERMTKAAKERHGLFQKITTES
jgi:hypothetical protein